MRHRGCPALGYALSLEMPFGSAVVAPATGRPKHQRCGGVISPDDTVVIRIARSGDVSGPTDGPSPVASPEELRECLLVESQPVELSQTRGMAEPSARRKRV